MTVRMLSSSAWRFPSSFHCLPSAIQKAFVPGINDLLKGGYPLKDGTTALSAQEKIEKGKTAIGAFSRLSCRQSCGQRCRGAGGCQSVERECGVFRLRLYQGCERTGSQRAAHLLYVPCHGDTGGVLQPLLHRGSGFSAYKKDFVRNAWMHWVAMLTIALGYLAGSWFGGCRCDVSRGPFRICCPQVPPFPNWM